MKQLKIHTAGFDRHSEEELALTEEIAATENFGFLQSHSGTYVAKEEPGRYLEGFARGHERVEAAMALVNEGSRRAIDLSEGLLHHRLGRLRQPPVDRCFATGLEVAVRGDKMPATEEPAVGAQGRRVRGLQHAVTRAVDNRLKQLFMGGEVRWGERAFQGKGFRSLGQEAIYAGGIRLRRGERFQKPDGTWNGDVLAPVIRDLGITLAMRSDEEAVRQVLSAQMGKAGPPMYGKDLHTGDWQWGVLPAAAPLAVGSLSIAGLAMAFRLQDSGRVAFSFIGEGGSSLGEWHEAINLCAARKLPAVFCLQNNQTALATPVAENSAARVFADKAAGYGIPGITLDGTDPEAIAAAFT